MDGKRLLKVAVNARPAIIALTGVALGMANGVRATIKAVAGVEKALAVRPGLGVVGTGAAIGFTHLSYACSQRLRDAIREIRYLQAFGA